MLSTPAASLRQRAEAWQASLGQGQVIEAADAVGGGSLPEGELEGWALALDSDDAEATSLRLREGRPPVIAHIALGRVLLHPRTIPPEQDAQLCAAVRAALAHD
jgi:seryl-tRNA(Sec) selenium transferase